MSMKTIARSLVAACCAVLGLTALAEAPTPVVVFNGDLINGAHKNGKFEVSKRTGDSQVSIADGFASLTKTSGTGAPQGVKIAWAQDTLPGTQLTVLVKYSGFDKNSGRTALLSAEWGTYDVSVSHSWDKKFNAGFYTHGSVGNNAGTERTASAAYDIPASGIMMVAMNSQPTPDTTAGTRVAFYDATTSALVEKWRDSGLRWKDSTFKNILVGGTVGPENHYYRPTMTVEAVAIFDKALTIDEANEYVFPTLHRFTSVSGTKTLAELLGETTIDNGDDVAIVMTGNTTLTLPEDVTIGQIGAYGTGELTIANLATPVTGTASIGALGIAGETLTKEGTGTLYVKNGDTSAVEGYSKVAIDGKTVNIVEGKVELNNGNDDANFNNPTFNIGTYGELDCYGWIRSKGTMTIENATDKTILTNRNGNNSNLADVPNIVKKGAGKLTMTCNLNSGNATTSTIDIQAGTLCLKNTNDKTLNGAITGVGNLEIDVGAGKSVKLGSANNTMASIIVTSGALDVAGQKPTSGYTIVANGGTIKSSGSNIYANETSIKSLTLNADTSLTDNKRFGLTTSSGDATSLVLNGHMLTVASGTTSECINFRNTTVTGEGTIAVGADSFMLVYDNGSGSMVAEDAKLTMTATSKLELNTAGTLTVKDFEAADGATIAGGNDRQGTLKVLGTYKNTNTIQKLELADGATIDVAEVPADGVVASATQTLMIDDIATIKLAIAGTETTDYTLSIGEDGKSVVATPVKTATELFLAGIAAGGDVTLTGAVTLDAAAVIPADKTVTLDLNGCTITAPKTVISVLGTLTVKDTGTDGKIVSTGHCGIAVGNGATLTVDSGVIESVEGAIITGDAVGATITINDGTFSASDNAVIAGNGTKREGEANTITINGGTFNGAIKSAGYIACGIYAPWKDQITVDGGTFNITGGCGVCARAGNVKIGSGVTINLINEGAVSGWVGDNKNAVPGVQAFFDYAAKYPGLAEGAAITSATKLTIAETQEWVGESAPYTLTDKPTGPTSWEETTPSEVIELPEGATTTVTASEIATWAEKNGVAFNAETTIPVNALIFNVAPSAAPTAETEAAAADAILEDLASKVDISKMTAGALDAATLELLEKEYPMATIKLVESTKIQSTDTAKFFHLSIELK